MIDLLDLQKIQKDSEYAIKRLERANEVAGGTRMGTQEAINVLKRYIIRDRGMATA